MAITAGKYLIHSALNENLVLMVSGGSKNKGARVTTGALTEDDNRCYWHAAVVATNYNSFYNVQSGTGSGYIMASSVSDGNAVTQNKYAIATGAWNAVLSGNTMTVNGTAVQTYYLKCYSNADLYLTVPNGGGELYLSTLLGGTSDNQEFYFEASTTVNRKLATPNSLRQFIDDTTYVINDKNSKISISANGAIKEPAVNKATFETQFITSGIYIFSYNKKVWYYNGAPVTLSDYGITYSGTPANGNTIIVLYSEALKSIIVPQWKCSSTAIVYEMRYRYRQYDMDGNIIGDWNAWNGWSMITAHATLNEKKKYTGIMASDNAIVTPIVDNVSFSRTEVQVEVRLTSAKNATAYNTNAIQHGMAVSQIINQYCVPSLSLTAALYSPDGLALTYSTDYTIAGSSILINSITDNGIKLIENYTFTGQDYTGDLYLNCDELYSLPNANDSIIINATIVEENGVVKATVEQTLTIEFDSSWGLTINPIYEISDRLTVLALIKEYSTLQLFMEKVQLNGSSLWVPCDIVAKTTKAALVTAIPSLASSLQDAADDDIFVVFEFAPPYGAEPNLMWLAIDEEANWTSSITAASGITLSSKFYSWYWIDENGVPRAAILKYRYGKIMQPSDDITPGANKFITTGREYPVFRYSKSIERNLNIEGTILKTESDPYCTYSDFEQLAIANHCVYRQPDGKWYQVAITGVKFTREEDHITVQIEQEAETR